MTAIRLAGSLLLAAWLLMGVSCGGDGNGDSASPGPTREGTPEATPSPKSSATGSPTRSAGEEPRRVGGIDMYTWDAWLADQKSLCPAGVGPGEGPYLGPPVYGVRDDEIPMIALPPNRKLLDARMCKDEQFTVVNYIMEGDVWILLVDGEPDWPIRARERGLDELQTVKVGETDAVLLPAWLASPQHGLAGPTVLVRAPFGMLVVYGRKLTNEDAIGIAEAIDLTSIEIPRADLIFKGEINGITFYDGRLVGACRYGPMGLNTNQSTSATSDERLRIKPGYLPDGADLVREVAYICPDLETWEATYQVPATGDQYWIVRKSGQPDWYSMYSRAWYTETTIAGRPAVIVESPGIPTDAGVQMHLLEDFGLTTIYGPDREEGIRILEGLNR